MPRTACSLLFITLVCVGLAQPSAVAGRRYMFGGGFGIDHGGLGVRVDARITPHIGLFGGVGTNFSVPGFSAGVHARILPLARFCPYLAGMVCSVASGDQGLDRISGPAAGGGLEWRSRTQPHCFRLGGLVALRSPAQGEDHPDGASWPILPSIGWSFAFGR